MSGGRKFGEVAPDSSRRSFLKAAGAGAAGLFLPGVLPRLALAAQESEARDRRSRGIVNPLHHAPRAKRVIHLYMAGGPSHLESLDPKPDLAKLDGKPFPVSFTEGQQLAQLQNTPLLARAPFCGFLRSGDSGIEIADIFPSISGIADEICVIRSMQTDHINHDPAHALMNTGSILKGRPSMGSWLLYGIGAETDDLPGFVVLTSAGKSGQQPISARQWSAGFLESRFQGILFQSRGEAVHYATRPQGVDEEIQAATAGAVGALNRLSARDPEGETRTRQYELALRMERSVPELGDFSKEPKSVLAMYGVERPGDGSFASNCLLARRLAERGVRFIQVYHRAWDHHGGIVPGMRSAAKDVDQASAALVKDLKQRGMLDDTLVLWGGEFGRTPMGQGDGRDHHILGFSIWLAGGGVRKGFIHGATDELGYNAVKDVVHVHDLHATMLHLLGIDHLRLTHRFQGRDFRLTDVSGNVVTAVLA